MILRITFVWPILPRSSGQFVSMTVFLSRARNLRHACIGRVNRAARRTVARSEIGIRISRAVTQVLCLQHLAKWGTFPIAALCHESCNMRIGAS